MVSELDINPRQARAAQAANEAERDANKRILLAQERLKAAQQETDQRLEQIRDQYVKSATEISGRQEVSIEKQKNEGYEQIRDLQRAQQANLRRSRTEGDRDERRLQDHYRTTLYNLHRDGEAQLTEEKKQFANELERQRAMSEFEYDAAHEDSALRLEMLRESQDEKYGTLMNQSQSQYEKMKENTSAANERARLQFEQRYKDSIAGQQKTLDRINSTASRKVEDIREDTAQRLDAYSSRQRDPFYKMIDLDADISETRDAFIVTARVPRHEQKNVTVSIKGGNHLVVSGYRRSEEKLEREPGHIQATSTYQSFSESVPLSWPVDGRALSREFKGDEIIVTIPKKPFYAAPAPHKSTAPARAKVERPKFPENIPTPEKTPAETPREPPPTASKRLPGSGTLG